MTRVIIRKSKNGEYKGFTCKGHSGFAARGEDIVCASISVLVINTVNSMEELAGECWSDTLPPKKTAVRKRRASYGIHDTGFVAYCRTIWRTVFDT